MADTGDITLKKTAAGAAKPEGWLKSQFAYVCELHKKLGALPGLLKDGEWSEGEALPRYLRALILLAGTLDDKELKDKVETLILPVFASANEGGGFGPRGGADEAANIEAVKAVYDYYLLTKSDTALQFLKKAFRNQYNMLGLTPSWYHARARLLETIPAIQAVYEACDESWLTDLAERIRDRSTNWFRIAAKFPYKDTASRYISRGALKRARRTVQTYSAQEASAERKLTAEKAESEWKRKPHEVLVETDGVNIAKAVKYPVTYGRLIGDTALKELSLKLIAALGKYHGTAAGMFTCCDNLAGTSASGGISVRASVEMIESLAEVLQDTGDCSVADLIEQIMFNVVPAACYKEAYAVQNTIQVNQSDAVRERLGVFQTDEYGNAYLKGMLSEGALSVLAAYPLFMRSLLMTRGNELNFMCYAPCTLEAETDCGKLVIAEETGYPFRNTIVFNVKHADGEPEVKINFRVPKGTSMQLISGGQVVATGSRLISVKCALRTGSTFMLKLDIPLSVHENRDGSVSFMKGSILMASKLSQDTKVSSSDSRVLSVNFATKWNYAPMAAKRPVGGIRRPFEKEHTSVNDFETRPYDADKPPFELKIRSKTVLNWDYGVSGHTSLPSNPKFSEESMERQYVPFGCTHIRMAHFPKCTK